MTRRIGRLSILNLTILLSVGLGGCAGSPARALVDASNRPGGLWAVVPCRYEPDIGDAVRSAVLVRTPKTCQAKWTHPTATQEQLVEDMTACSKAAFWVLSPRAAQDQRLECMASKGYRSDTSQNDGEPTSPRVPAKTDEANPAISQAAESPNTPIATAESATPGLESQLARLDDLRARGVITEDEHAVLRKRALASHLPTGPAASLTARPPSRPALAPGALNWPPVGSSHVLSERKSGSYGSGRRQVRVTYHGEQIWNGKKVRAFSDGALTTYVDDRRRILARVGNSALVEFFDPYFVFADWPLRVGKSWSNRFRYSDYISNQSFDGVQYDGHVEALEDVRTAAGTFKAFRISLEGTASKNVFWYSSDLGLVIKHRVERFANHHRGAGSLETELVSYDFKS